MIDQSPPHLNSEPPASPPDPVHPALRGHTGPRPPLGIPVYLAIGTAIFFLLIGLNRVVPDAGAIRLWQQLVTYIVLVSASLGAAFAMSKIERRPFGAYGLPWEKGPWRKFFAGVIWGIAALSILILAMRVCGVFTFAGLALHGNRILKFAGFWTVLFLLVGFFEEFTFRGYTLHNLSRAIGFWPAAFTLSAAFGALHLANPGEAWIGALAAAVIGLFFCFTVRRTGSMWFAVGMHASWDWGESYLYSVPDSGGLATGHLLHSSLHGPRWLSGGSVGPEGSLLLFVVIAVVWVAFDRIHPHARYASE